ncbi:MAG: hypothetical protein B7Y05_07505 [Polynucleobacter sp. 24-46-87]|jgi:hypothetical protein|uniref:hypothetical protein n=1 Tax=Burkholderiales TaxID=80840 RepID=UPI000BDDC7C2|nr:MULTISPECIES: hypothetical protein [Burkholderiales]OYY17169.1 MAG: hypothetical protein B7Y67_08440 [Polynucleobacter sp. 35-46-11]OZA14338.1 MAG: hypothetical protein B7Y05_07505 [Polynucleobacter sp. 24-46-87]HQR86935.1 hypothetical protein [Limnohabitans sp.]HQS26967.1 hypothetical protein [Limnohabitans sp.]
MSKVTKTQTIVLVSYSTPAIPACFAKSLQKHLQSQVWESRSHAEEDVRVICDDYKNPKFITEIRYQFGEDFYDNLADEIGELISEQMDVWMAINNIEDLTTA